ncbi:uncharacterized protein [Haliotis asinina]|uniref:uncharacterized protein n=1 Tax=Haliotis asinina TaxID=109174 RepID=UPI00353266BE
MVVVLGVFVILGLIQGIVCPGPRPGGHEVSCYHCDHKEHFPDCLNSPHVCHHDEVCEVLYGGDNTVIKCTKAHECQHDVDKAHTNCGVGGKQTDEGCEICCADDACVSEQVAALQGLPLASTPMTAIMSCPDHCRPDDIDTCFVTAPMCDSGEFCQLQGEHGELKGHCTKDVDLRHCLFKSYDENTAVCSEGDLSLIQGHHTCTYCCLDSDCGVAPFFNTSTGDLQTTEAFGSTGVPGSTPPPNPLLYGQCVDQIMDNGCSALPTVCTSEVGIQLCPQTCGLCDVLESQFHGKALCEDHLINNECEVYKVTKDICNNPLAKFTCPKACDICETILLDLVNQVKGGPLPTQNPQPATQMTDGAVTDGIAMTDGAVTDSIAMTDGVVTQTNVIDLTVNYISGGTDGACVDTVQGISCENLQDICNDPLSRTVCRKFCGLCGNDVSTSASPINIQTAKAVVSG